MRLIVPKFLLQFMADLHISKRPLWFSYKPEHHKVNGNEVRTVLDQVQPGDILLNRHNGYLSTILTPGQWAHAALYIGNNKIIHSIGSGVQEDDILHFCRCDSIAILRVIKSIKTNRFIELTINKAINLKRVKTKYDFEFEQGNDKYYCTELVDVCMNNLFKNDYKKVFGRIALKPDAMFKSKKIDKILVFQH